MRVACRNNFKADIQSIENNVFLVKRLIQRTDLRNPDPGPHRYTSLAWAAVLGHVETFELLLNEGHDDDEISKVRAYTESVSKCRAQIMHCTGFGREHHLATARRGRESRR